MIARSRVMMSWDFLSKAPGSVQVTLILLWIIGAGAIAVSIFLRGRYAHMSHGLLGLAGILVWVIQLSGRSNAGRMAGLRTALGVVEVFYVLFLLGAIVATIIRLRLSPTTIIRLVQGFCAGILVIFALVVLIDSISSYTDLSESRRSRILFDFIFKLLLQLVLIASGVIAVVHATAVNMQSKKLSWTALYMSCGALVCFFGYLIIRPAISAERLGPILFMTNLALLVVPLVFMFCSGLTEFICGLPAGPGGFQRDTAPGGGNIEARLQKLNELQLQGLITDKEYSDKRAKILDGL